MNPGLQPSDFTEQRNDAAREGAKGLLLMNGGGAVALLAFLQAIWKDNPRLAKYIVVSIAVLAVGVLLAGVFHFFRYQASFNFQSRNDSAYTTSLPHGRVRLVGNVPRRHGHRSVWSLVFTALIAA